MDKPNYQLEIQLKEYELICNRISVLINYDLKILNLCLIIYGVGFGYGMSGQTYSNHFLLFFPFGIFMILFYSLHVYLIVLSLCGYKASIESLLNKEYFKFEILIGEKQNDMFKYKSIALFASHIVYGFLLIFSLVKSIEKAYILFTSLEFILYLAFILLNFILLIVSFIRFLKVENKAFGFANMKHNCEDYENKS